MCRRRRMLRICLQSRSCGRRSQGGYNTLLDGTGDSSIEKLDGKVSNMRDAGQKVVAHYVTVPTDVAVSRSNLRAKKSGRAVPESVIRSTHKNVSAVVPKAIERGLFDEFDLWDNSGSSAVHVATGRGRGNLQVLDQPRWDSFVAKGEE